MIVVDDFGILHGNDDSRERLFQVLRLQYVITTDLTGSKYLGIDINFNAKLGNVSLSKMLSTDSELPLALRELTPR